MTTDTIDRATPSIKLHPEDMGPGELADILQKMFNERKSAGDCITLGPRATQRVIALLRSSVRGSTPVKGVWKRENVGKRKATVYIATAHVNRERVTLYYGPSYEDAVAARQKWEREQSGV